MTQTMKAWFAVPGPDGAVFELRESPVAAPIRNVFVTAHDALVTNAAARSGESVMVTAAPSGVGTAAIQIARHIGANPVIATTRTPAKANSLRALGAHEVIDSRDAGKWVEAVLRATG